MQIQKHLFRIAERALKSTNAPVYWSGVLIFCTILSLYLLIVFISGNLFILPNNNQISKCFQKSLGKDIKTQLQHDAIYIIYPKDNYLPKYIKLKQQLQIVQDNQLCTIIKGMNTSWFTEKPFEFTWTPNVLYFDTQDRYTYNFVNYTISFKENSNFKSLFYGANTLFANELITNPLKILPDNPFIRSSTVSISTPLPQMLDTKGRIIRVLKSIMYYFVISVVTSLYIYGTIIAAPAVIMLFLKCSNFARNGGNMTQVYKIFPWIGMHTLIRQTSQRETIKNTSGQICKAIIFYFFFLYLIYYVIVLQISLDIFYQKTQQGLEQMLFGYIALIEFCSKVFMRTRPFLKYFPTIHTMLMLIFLIYCQFVPFGLKKNLCMIVCMASAALFAYLVIKLEIPGQTTWDRTKKYTPTIDRPRIGVLPLFNVSWINNLPDQWTLMYPLFGRENFTQRQLALVDRNFEELDQMFAPNHNQPVINN